jgi:hypothetical protein
VRETDGFGAFDGGKSDVAFKVPGPLGLLAVVPGSPRRLYAVARADTAAPSAGLVYVLDLHDGSVDVTPYVFPSRITAGPIASEVAPSRVLVGLENGRVCEIRTDTQAVRDLAGVGTVAVTGLALDGQEFAASGRAGALVMGAFAGNQAGASVGTVTRTTDLPTDRVLQPLILRLGNAQRQVTVVDRTRGSARTFAMNTQALVDVPGFADEPWQGRELGEPVGPPAVADLDADGLPEIAFISESGRVGYWNTNGSTSPGWPPEVEREGFVSRAGPLPLVHPGLSADPLVVASLGNGLLVALDRARRNAPGFPLGTSVGARGTPAFDLTVVPPVLYVAGGDTMLYALGLAGEPANASATSTWTAEGGGPTRSYADPTTYGSTVGGAGSAIVDGTVRAYPNPARQQPITFAFRLREAGRITLSVYDAAARLVERIERDGQASDNAIIWDPAGRTSGLYVARLEVPGQVVTTPFALIR